MNDLLVDTDVFSFLFKRDTRAELYRNTLQDARLFLSFQTIAELYRWALHRKWSDRTRDRLVSYLHRIYIVIPPDDETARHWAAIMDDGRKSGHPIASTDAWIAATALRHDLGFVTHNRSHFVHVSGLRIIPNETI